MKAFPLGGVAQCRGANAICLSNGYCMDLTQPLTLSRDKQDFPWNVDNSRAGSIQPALLRIAQTSVLPGYASLMR